MPSAQGGRFFPGKRPFFWALAVSALAHGVVLLRVLEPSAPGSGPKRLQVLLAPSTTASSAPAAAEPVPAARSSRPETTAIAQVPEANPPTSDLQGPPPQVLRRPLNLERPADWDDLIRGETDSASTQPSAPFAFTPALAAAVADRETMRRRQMLVAERAAGVYGVADAAYARAGARGTELKMDGRCVTLVEERSVERGVRWWSGTCTESRTAPMVRDPPEYDPLGYRIVD